jgi:hypothetical protein
MNLGISTGANVAVKYIICTPRQTIAALAFFMSGRKSAWLSWIVWHSSNTTWTNCPNPCNQFKYRANDTVITNLGCTNTT